MRMCSSLEQTHVILICVSSPLRMVPTTVERLREGKVLERVLRSINKERVYKRSDGSAEKESGMKG